MNHSEVGSTAMLKSTHNMHSQMMPMGAEHSMHGHMMSEHSMMKMWFHGGCEEVILFDFWRINSISGLLISCIITFAMSALYEGIKWFRVYLQLNREHCSKSSCQLKEIESHKELLGKSPQNEVVYRPTTVSSNPTSSRCCYGDATSPFAFQHLIQGFLYAVQLTFAYWMMLIAMTYNTYLTAAVIIGAAFGHWLFAVLKYFDSRADRLDSLATDACH
uniref:Copper transport protein n=1 Tax=Syphacia muris TaxID=451379 RepID=A0A0N5AKV5_9BILA